MKLSTAGLLGALIVIESNGQETDPLAIYRQYHTCNICATGKQPSLASLGLPNHGANTTQESLTCEEAQAMAKMDSLSPASCLLLRLRIVGDCVCAVFDSTPALAAAENNTDIPEAEAAENTTDISVADATEIATVAEAEESTSDIPAVDSAPVIDLAATLAPSSTQAPAFSTSVLITPVAESTLTHQQLVAFEGTMENFLEDAIEGIDNLECQVTDQNASNSRIVAAVEVIVSCHTNSTTLSTEEFSALASEVVESMAGALLEDLRENPDFNHEIATVFNFGGEMDADVTEEAEGSKRWVLYFAAAFPLTGLIALCSVMVFLVAKGFIKSKASGKSTDGTDMAFPPRSSRFSRLSTPVAAAASIAAIARQSSDPEVKNVGSALEKEDSSLLTGGTGTLSSHRPNFSSRTVMAPEGKLGIVIDTTLEGPVVHSVKPTSPLLGLLFAGDMIVAVNNEETRTMSAIALTDLMSRTSNIPRELVVLSQDVSG